MCPDSQFNFETLGDPANPALLLLHGFMGSSEDWMVDIAPALVSDFCCIAVDLPGHGQSLLENDSAFGMETCAESIIRLLDLLSINRCHLMGYSMGGRLGLYLATKFPNRFDKVVLESASPGLKTAEERTSHRAHDQQLAVRIETKALGKFLSDWYRQPLFATMDQSTDRFRNMVERKMSNDPAGLSRSLRFMGVGAQPSLWGELDKISGPLLLIVGERDAKFRSIASEIAAGCGEAEVCTIHGAGHSVHFEKPKEFIEQVSLYLKK